MEPTFTCLAQVYNLDKVQKTWTPMTEAVIPVQFFAGDENRIKAVDMVKGVIHEISK